MKITLRIEEDAESAASCWPEVTKVVRQWMTSHAASPPELPLPQQRKVEMPLEMQTDDLITAVMQLHTDLYDLEVNFTVSVD